MIWLANEPVQIQRLAWKVTFCLNKYLTSHFNTNLLVVTQQVVRLTACKQISIMQNSDNGSRFTTFEVLILLQTFFKEHIFLKCVFTVLFFQWNILIDYSRLFSQFFWVHFQQNFFTGYIFTGLFTGFKIEFLPVLFMCFFRCFFHRS